MSVVLQVLVMVFLTFGVVLKAQAMALVWYGNLIPANKVIGM